MVNTYVAGELEQIMENFYRQRCEILEAQVQSLQRSLRRRSSIFSLLERQYNQICEDYNLYRSILMEIYGEYPEIRMLYRNLIDFQGFVIADLEAIGLEVNLENLGQADPEGALRLGEFRRSIVIYERPPTRRTLNFDE